MMFTSPRRRLALTGAAGLTAVALVAGCGSSGSSAGGVLPGAPSKAPSTASSTGGTDSGNPRVRLAASVDKVKALKNGKISFKVNATEDGKDVSIEGDAVVDYENEKFELTTALPASVTDGKEISLEARVIGKTAYIKLPDEYASKLGGKSWVKLDTATLSKGSGSSTSPSSQDPTQILQSLKDVSASVKELGKETIRGVETTHYRAEIDPTKAAGESGTDASQLERYKELTGSGTVPVDVWLDGDGLPRRIAVEISPKASSGPAASVGRVAFSVDFYDFGKADTDGIVAPPAGEVGELPSSLLGGSGLRQLTHLRGTAHWPSPLPGRRPDAYPQAHAISRPNGGGVALWAAMKRRALIRPFAVLVGGVSIAGLVACGSSGKPSAAPSSAPSSHDMNHMSGMPMDGSSTLRRPTTGAPSSAAPASGPPSATLSGGKAIGDVYANDGVGMFTDVTKQRALPDLRAQPRQRQHLGDRSPDLPGHRHVRLRARARSTSCRAGT